MSEAERIRRATRRAEEAAKAQIDALAASTARQVEALVERLTGAFIGSDTPEFQQFMAAFQAQQEAALRAISTDIERIADEEAEEATQSEEQRIIAQLEEMGFSRANAEILARNATIGDFNAGIASDRTFFSVYDLERAVSGGMPIEYIIGLYTSDSGLIQVVLQ
jgi:phospholipase/lecithinase/hemolysin